MICTFPLSLSSLSVILREMAPNSGKKNLPSASQKHIFKRIKLGDLTSSTSTDNPKISQDFPKDVNQNEEVSEVEFRLEIAWRSAVMISSIHVLGIYGAVLWITGHVSVKTFFIQWVFGMMSALGTTGGAHRYWAHKSYQATLPLQIFLALCQTIACQNSIYEWVRDHRVHHKYTETDADPHNAKRGFFFSHVGWLMVRKHPDVRRKGASVSMVDLENDPIVTFQRRHYLPLAIFFCFIFPTLVVVWSGETLFLAFTMTVFRYMLSLNFTWLVNSLAHLHGSKPYDKNINPSENLWVSLLAGGEGWHNYHHVFPWDYKTSELGLYWVNFTALFIDAMAWMGLAYGRKTVPPRMVELRMQRTGDGSNYRH